ncbi:hypothetical protein QYM36_002114, partial [Artemia franciscana]
NGNASAREAATSDQPGRSPSSRRIQVGGRSSAGQGVVFVVSTQWLSSLVRRYVSITTYRGIAY